MVISDTQEITASCYSASGVMKFLTCGIMTLRFLTGGLPLANCSQWVPEEVLVVGNFQLLQSLSIFAEFGAYERSELQVKGNVKCNSPIHVTMKFNNLVLVTVSNVSFENRLASEINTWLLAYNHNKGRNFYYKMWQGFSYRCTEEPIFWENFSYGILHCGHMILCHEYLL